FETDDQLVLDEYLSGRIAQKNFEKEVKLWDNYSTDYKPLVEFAKENNLSFIATNIPRRYASLVNKNGFESLDSLSVEAKRLVMPLPVNYDPELKSYKAMLEMNEGGMQGGSHATENLPKAQAVKDATMAYSIMQHWQPGKIFIHYNGSYHSDNYEGIVWYLKQENPALKIMTISTVEQDTITDLKEEFLNLADYIICVPTGMTKTY
ncbi:MAG: ChaN family lipoprotein, partial [Bacteroidetes bacterium]|nr:ChaN family lipoprotein [Bacteroidota bacterium]